MKTSWLLLLLTALTGAFTVHFKEAPSKLQLYPRNQNDKGKVIIDGIVIGDGADSVVIDMARNGILKQQQKKYLTYRGDSAFFYFEMEIIAELAEYRFVCSVNGQNFLYADSIVAGDVFLIEGQSNARLGKSALNEYVRTMRLLDSSWTLTNDCAWAPLPQKIIEISKMPICVINEAVPGSVIGSHQKGTEPYNNQLLRTQLAKVQREVKAIFWYQGEWNSGYGAESGYPPQFSQLYDSWMADYPGVKKIYLVQINTWKTAGSRELREAQRRIANSYGNIEIMPAIGGLYYDGHGGYTELGNNLYSLVAAEFMGSRDTHNIKAPQIRRAYYTSASKECIALEFDQPVFWNAKKDSVVYLNEKNALTPGFLKDYFALDDTIWEAADSCWFDTGNRRIIIKLKEGLTAQTISYMPDWYNLRGCDAMSGPILWNSRKVPAVTFAQFPVEDPVLHDTGKVVSINLAERVEQISCFEQIALLAVVKYACGKTDTNHGVNFYSLDTSVLKVNSLGIASALKSGMAWIVAEKNGISDTTGIVISTEFLKPDSMKFSKREKSLAVEDSISMGLTGFFSSNGNFMTVSLDSLATYLFDSSALSIQQGRLKALQPCEGVAVEAMFVGKRCTLSITVKAMPSFVRRINIQPKGDSITAINGWLIDSGLVYSAARGFGSVVARSGGQHSPKIANYLRATWAQPDRYRIDCPDGEYWVRFCQSQWLWAQPGNITAGSDTLAMNPQLHAGDGIATDGQLWISDKRIIVSGDSGFQFRVYGGLAYIVLISTDGADLNTVAMDGADAANNKPPMSTRTEMSNYKGCIRKPRSYPNPFNPSTTVLFDLPSGVSARYAVYDIRGRLVYSKAIKALPNIQVCRLSLKFNDMIPNQSTGSGSYFGKVESSDGKTYTHRLMLIR